MMLHMCHHKFVYTSSHKVCHICGEEFVILSLDTWSKHSSPLFTFRNYDRTTRFTNKIDKLLGIHRGPKCSDPIWTYLENIRLITVSSVRKALKKSRLKSKHYDCLRIFCDVFTQIRVIEDVHSLKASLLKKFRHIYDLWQRCNIKQFFSYDYLLRKFITDLGSGNIIYLKPPTTRRRMQKYIDLETFIQSQHANTT